MAKSRKTLGITEERLELMKMIQKLLKNYNLTTYFLYHVSYIM